MKKCPLLVCVCVCVCTLKKCLVCVCVDDWLKLDDDKVSMVKEEDILKLSGGGKAFDNVTKYIYTRL